MVMFSNLS